VIGAPNAGKSTLVNALVGPEGRDRLAKAQTTRARLMGIALAGEDPDHPGRHARHLRAQAPARPGDGRRRLGRRAGSRRDPAGGRWRKKRATSSNRSSNRCKGRPERKLLVLNKVDDACAKEPLLICRAGADRAKASSTRCSSSRR
jgi:GTP-binding protein Era